MKEKRNQPNIDSCIWGFVPRGNTWSARSTSFKWQSPSETARARGSLVNGFQLSIVMWYRNQVLIPGRSMWSARAPYRDRAHNGRLPPTFDPPELAAIVHHRYPNGVRWYR